MSELTLTNTILLFLSSFFKIYNLVAKEQSGRSNENLVLETSETTRSKRLSASTILTFANHKVEGFSLLVSYEAKVRI